MNKIKTGLNKIKKASGESLAETLVASLIGGLALLMLAQMLTAASGMIRSSQETMNEYIISENSLNGEGTLVSTSEGKVEFKILKSDGTPESSNKNIASKGSFSVTYYTNTNGEVTRYEKKSEQN